MNLKHLQNMYHANVNAYLMVENVVQIKSGITINVGASVKNIIYAKKKVCAPNKTEDLNLSIFNIITEINESKALAKHVCCKCKCKFHGRKCNSGQK